MWDNQSETFNGSILMKRYILVVLAMTFFLAACGATQGVDQGSGTEATPTPEIPFSDLGPLLIQENDLPAGYSGGVINDKVPSSLNILVMPVADYVVSQRILKNDATSGIISVLYYRDKGSVETAYETILADMDKATSLNEIGDMSAVEMITDNPRASQNGVALVFRQCNAVVLISMQGTDDAQAAAEYAKRLASRLKSQVCP
jgi:hypothetical protein